MPDQVLAALDGNLLAFNYEVESTGRPSAGSAGTLVPRFHITAYTDGERLSCEPLVLGWQNADHTAMVLDPGFCMTFGLMPRTLADGSIHWDDPAAPQFDVAIVDPPSIYESLRTSDAKARVSRAHLQDYLTLRGVHLVQVYYEERTAARDDAVAAMLAGRDRLGAKLQDRELEIMRNLDGSVTAQVWGARVIAGPGDLPVTAGSLDAAGLTWPGFPTPVTHQVARTLGLNDYVYVRDSVLAAYEGREGFTIYPESGAVAFGGQWSVGFCDRVGRDVIRLELKKLYEGTPDREIRHWHAHAVASSADLEGAAAMQSRNVAVRADALVLALTDVGEKLSRLNTALRLPERLSRDFVGLDRVSLGYHGWWNGPFVEPVTRHIPLEMERDAFLERCLDLDKLSIEAFAERHLRPLVRALGITDTKIDSWRGLKLLDRVACLAQVANAGGLDLVKSASEVARRLDHEGTSPAQPLKRLFALSDLRQLKGHRKQDLDAALRQALERFNIDPRSAAAGFGAALDAIYDGVIEELASLDETLTDALMEIE